MLSDQKFSKQKKTRLKKRLRLFHVPENIENFFK